ncbi:SIMPL domain-containing protein [Alkaliphilus hydrothermalis]|uniref:Uncharacterized protein YggE n=1 Tax=Alkaliphilus hydrothermalis TaxID=1482730 RepID=A0ABS2NPG8_9FIRM|nr:SIMPL domain-containing protein [Alkaliphilus hydrothermalis]MBM7614827.1 uncharacterized protein YggE [Alkaliphilus hydrothermalis]
MKSSRVKSVALVAFLAVTMVGFFLLGGLSSITAKAEAPKGAGEISVAGTGKVMAKPDIGIVNIGIETSHKDSKIAQEENTKLSNQVMKALKDMSIKADDIKTSSYNMYRERHYNHQNGKTTDGDFKVGHSIEVIVRDIDKVGNVIDTTTKSGATQVNNIRFGISDTSIYYQEALRLAVKDANVKATTIADTLEVKVGKPSKVTEGGIAQPYQERNVYYEAMKSMNDAGGTPIASGELEITAQIQVIYNY